MMMTTNTELLFLETENSGAATLRVHPTVTEARVASHFIAVIDVSESMADNNKLEHVRHCMRLLLKFLMAEDELSLITFGERSEIVVNRMKMDRAGVVSCESAIHGLRVDGCTNFSAGLAHLRSLLETVRSSGSALKQGVLILTDGHANRGVSDPLTLKGMVGRLHTAFPEVTFSFLAYGVDHNADLLKGMAEDTAGSYSVVEGLESAAMTMGDALGGIISCIAQTVTVSLPAGTTVTGPQKITAEGVLELGDLYAGSDVLVLLTMPAAAAGAGPIQIRGISLPSLEPFSETVITRLETARNVEIELTRLRYRCSDLFRRIRVEGGRTDRAELLEEIRKFNAALDDEAYVGNPILQMLRAEAASMRVALENLQRHGGATQYLTTMLVQHEAFTSLGRGTTSAIAPEDPAAAHRHTHARFGRGGARFGATVTAAAGDPEDEEPSTPPPAEARILSPLASTSSRVVATAMRSMSQHPNEN